MDFFSESVGALFYFINYKQKRRKNEDTNEEQKEGCKKEQNREGCDFLSEGLRCSGDRPLTLYPDG